MDAQELLNIAKGVGDTSKLADKKKYWMIVPEPKRELEQKRKMARRNLHKVVKYIGMNKELPEHMEDAHILKDIIQEQLDSNRGLRWEMFAWKWDLHPKDHTKIVIKEQWFASGGGVDPEFGSMAPTAFTKNESYAI